MDADGPLGVKEREPQTRLGSQADYITIRRVQI